MTWGELKRAVEKAGGRDSDELDMLRMQTASDPYPEHVQVIRAAVVFNHEKYQDTATLDIAWYHE